jgi:hypothetical protein
MMANLARLHESPADVPPDTNPERRGAVVDMKRNLSLATFRILVALGAIAGSAVVLEAGRRWL